MQARLRDYTDLNPKTTKARKNMTQDPSKIVNTSHSPNLHTLNLWEFRNRSMGLMHMIDVGNGSILPAD